MTSYLIVFEKELFEMVDMLEIKLPFNTTVYF